VPVCHACAPAGRRGVRLQMADRRRTAREEPRREVGGLRL